VRIVTRDVSPRLGQRIAAQCLELQLDSSLEALTIVVPARGIGAVNFEVEAQNREGAVRWTDAAGRHRVVTGTAQALQLPAGLELSAGLAWWYERGNLPAADDDEAALIAALPTEAPQVPADLQAITHLPEQSGRMIVMVNIPNRRWEKLSVAEPRRG
jgi:hypothetical protein